MSNKLIDRLEELADEMKVIVHQLRVPSTIQAVEDVIEFEGKQYKKVDREARVGDVITYSEIGGGWMNISPNKPYKVYEEDGLFGLLFTRDNGGPCRVYGDDSKNGRSSGNVNVYELIVEGKKKIKGITIEIDAPKSANQKRAEIIEKAKKFVEANTRYNGRAMAGVGVRLKGGWVCIPEFIVNDTKRTVVVLFRLTGSPQAIQSRGIAKCMSTDVFNEHIGKAIALGRALGLDVSEFENAVQPDEVVAEHIVKWEQSGGNIFEITERVGLQYAFKDLSDGWESRGLLDYRNIEELCTIINDTNAEYEVV